MAPLFTTHLVAQSRHLGVVFNAFISHIQSVTKSHPFDLLSLTQICTLTATEFVQDSFLALSIVILYLIVVSGSMALWLELVE